MTKAPRAIPSSKVSKVANLKLSTHLHAPPACTVSNHPSSCRGMGRELSCIRFTKQVHGVKLDICICNHLT